jgi:hypothetical protein
MAVTRIFVAAVALATAAAACNDNDFIDQAVLDTRDEGIARGDALAANASVELTGASAGSVIGMSASILFVINDRDIQESMFTGLILDGGDFDDYAAEIFDDHVAANDALAEVVRGLGASFLPSTTADQIAADANAAMSGLRATPPQNLSFEFIHLMVLQHAETLVILDELAAQVGPGALGDYIADTQVLEEAHLSEGENLLDDFY